MIHSVADAGGDNIHGKDFFISFKIGDELHSRIPIDARTINEAEYTAVIKLLEHLLLTNTKDSCIIRTDSKLVVQQINGKWKVRASNLLPLYLKAIGLISQIRRDLHIHIQLEWWSRCNSVREVGH